MASKPARETMLLTEQTPVHDASGRREFLRTVGHLSVIAALGATALLARARAARAEPPSSPIPVQAQIVTRILPFERGFGARAPREAVVAIAERAGDADSVAAARQMAKALSDIGKIGGKPLRIRALGYVNAEKLAADCKQSGAVAVYLTPSFADDVAAIAQALTGSGVLSVAAVESYVPAGAVLGVQVSSGKPRMSINLARARAQKLDFSSAVLQLAKVY